MPSAAPGLAEHLPLISISTKVTLNRYRNKKGKLHEVLFIIYVVQTAFIYYM